MEKEAVIEALCEFVKRVASEKGMATPEELAALPGVAKVLLDYFCSGSALLLSKKL